MSERERENGMERPGAERLELEDKYRINTGLAANLERMEDLADAKMEQMEDLADAKMDQMMGLYDRLAARLD